MRFGIAGPESRDPINGMRLRPQTDCSMLPAGNPRHELLRICTARWRACWMRLLGNPGPFGRARRKEPESEFPPVAHASDLSHPSPCY